LGDSVIVWFTTTCAISACYY